jgi:hypothetical protein
MAKGNRWIITTNADRPIKDIAKDLGAAGLKGVRVLKEVGSITGSADEKVVTKLRKVRGVVDVSPDADVDVGPPDSSETW